MTVKSTVVWGLLAGVFMMGAPAAAQVPVPVSLLTNVCLPYASRSLTFEKSIRAARDLEFRRPVNDRAPMEDWASEVTLVSNDGVWQVRLEEGSIEFDNGSYYFASCTISSRRTTARALADLGRRAFRNPAHWTSPGDNPWRWDRRSAYPDEYGLAVEVSDRLGEHPTMTVKGSYY